MARRGAEQGPRHFLSGMRPPVARRAADRRLVSLRLSGRRPRLALLTLLLLAGCGTIQKMAIQKDDYLTSNALSYDHPFTDAGSARARKDAERECGYRKKAAVRTGGACSLSKCTTHFQCMDPADADKYKE